MALTVRFDPAAPYEVEETDVPFARPGGKELLARIYSPGARHGFIQPASPDTDMCLALLRGFIGRPLG
jgi:hypothetical protein